MKSNYTHTKDIVKLIGGVLFLVSVIFIWILIDAGNVYAQSKDQVISKIESIQNVTSFREGADRGNVVENPIADQGFEIYPNPTRGGMVFDFEFIIRTGDEETSVGIYDSMGRLAYQTSLSEETIQTGLKLNLGTELPGNYLIVVRRGDQVFTKRVLKI